MNKIGYQFDDDGYIGLNMGTFIPTDESIDTLYDLIFSHIDGSNKYKWLCAHEITFKICSNKNNPNPYYLTEIESIIDKLFKSFNSKEITIKSNNNFYDVYISFTKPPINYNLVKIDKNLWKSTDSTKQIYTIILEHFKQTLFAIQSNLNSNPNSITRLCIKDNGPNTIKGINEFVSKIFINKHSRIIKDCNNVYYVDIFSKITDNNI